MPRTAAHDFRVVAHEPHRDRLRAWAVAVGMLGAALLGFWVGGLSTTDGRAQALEELAILTERHESLQTAYERLRQTLNDERLERQVGGVFSEQVRDTLTDQATQIAALEEQLRFYRNLMTDSDDSELQIADFELFERLDGQGIRFRLLLVQSADRHDEIAGRVEVRVIGSSDDGQAEVLSGSVLGADMEQPLPFRFRYFQRLAGEISLPGGFVPEGVEIVARSDAENGFRLQRTFNWEYQEV